MGEITDRQMGTKPSDKDIWLNESAPKGHGRFIARITPGGDRLFYYRYTDSTGKRIRLPLGAYCSGQPIPDSGLSFFSATAGGSPSLA